MPDRIKVAFATPALPSAGALVLVVGDDLALSATALSLVGADVAAAVARAAAAEGFKGKANSGMTMLAPAGLEAERLVVVGVGSAKERAEANHVDLGGAIAGRLGQAKAATVLLDGPQGWRADAEAAADIALGAQLRAYRFDAYKTKKGDDAGPDTVALTIGVADPAAARRAAKARAAIADGVLLARDLVNEPPNVLYPEEFARRAEALTKLGVEVEVLDEKKLEKIGMRALLGVGQGSVRGSRVVIMRWNGAKSAKAKPWPSWARASRSTPAASRSSRRRTWRT